MAIKVPMAPAIRPRDPDVGAAADKHDIAVRGTRDIDVVGFRDDLFHHNRPHGRGRTRGRRVANDRAASGRLWSGLNCDRSWATCHAARQAKRSRDSGDRCSPFCLCQTMPRVPDWILCRDIGRLKGIFSLARRRLSVPTLQASAFRAVSTMNETIKRPAARPRRMQTTDSIQRVEALATHDQRALSHG
jgi:hypothetical protein